ncbi:MAG: membrane-associated HD superfamily phosphohydrolase [Candidatus Paceibacteria bacterium]|jgi:membrane-associated HD superfamily phosphohydrolase
MTKQRLLFLIGIWVAVLPFLGFPQSIRNVFFLVTGLGIILLSYFMYIQIKAINEMDEKGGGIFAQEEKEADDIVEDKSTKEEKKLESEKEITSDVEVSLDGKEI